MSEGYDPADVCGDCDCEFPECGRNPDSCAEEAAADYWESAREAYE
jgi:hypothetical protein